VSAILVTGGAGLIGAAVCRGLRDRGHRVIATFSETPAPDLGPGIEWRRCDLRSARALNEVEADAVAHCAAVLPATFDCAEEAARTNRAIDETVFGWVAGARAALVYASGASLYGDAEPEAAEGFTEAAPLVPEGPYLAEKVWAEARGRELAARVGSRFTSLRINAPYGPGQRAQTVMMRFIADARAGKALRYYGEGTREQDFTYVEDVAAGFEAALDGPGGVFNISAGQPVNMRDLATLVAELTGLDQRLVGPAGVPDPQEGRRARFDTSAARQVLGWRAHTPLREGILRCLTGRGRST
jgi:UDP-glucose 4-epimerase